MAYVPVFILCVRHARTTNVQGVMQATSQQHPKQAATAVQILTRTVKPAPKQAVPPVLPPSV